MPVVVMESEDLVSHCEDFSPSRKPATPTLEELRYANELWLQVRDRYLERPEPKVLPWCVSVE